MKLETVGVSPKAIAAGLAGYFSPLIVGVIAEQLGAEVKVDTVAALLLPLLTALATFVVARLAKPGLVVNTDTGTIPGEHGLKEVPGAKDGEEAEGDSETFER